jgi:hypothetical protein
MMAIALGAVLAVLQVSWSLADGDADPDGCTLVQSADVRSLITSEEVDVRSQSGNPAPGESTCAWYAYEAGYAAEAAPVGSFSLAYYHFATAADAKKQMRRLSEGVQSLDLVRTDDASQDEVITPDWGTAIARHDVDIAVIDASRTTALAREKANWSYRVEALALQAAGAKVLGPVDDRATADACHLLPRAQILALLTLSPSTLTSSLDGNQCQFSVEDRSGIGGASVSNHGGARLTSEDFGSTAAALTFQHQQTPFFPASHLVSTAVGTDTVVVNPENPAEVWAVHGPYYVTLVLTGVTGPARQYPSWAYRVQRAALEAAGARIIPMPGVGPDPVVSAVVPEKGPKTPSWKPQLHAAPRDAAVIDPLLHVLAIATGARFFILPVFIGLPVLFSAWRRSRAKKKGRTSGAGAWLIPLGVTLGLIDLLFGTTIATTLIYHYGVAGTAIVTDTYNTGSQYNSHDILGHHVLIRTSNQQVISGSFDTADFNVYPPQNETHYPGQGDEFTVRYLRSFPDDFVTVANDDSPWAHGLRCGDLTESVQAAAAKADFAPGNAAYREAHARAVTAAQQAGCETD